MDGASDYMQKAIESFESGFSTKSSKKEAVSNLNRAYTILRSSIEGRVLEIAPEDRTKAQEDMYFGLPGYLHQWKAFNSSAVVKVFPYAAETVAKIEDLAELLEVIKAAPVVTIESKNNNEKVDQVHKYIQDVMALRNEKYNRALNMREIFGGLPVYANVHMVRNQYGTEFVRAFYYLNGVITPLNIIIAASQIRKEKKDGSNQG